LLMMSCSVIDSQKFTVLVREGANLNTQNDVGDCALSILVRYYNNRILVAESSKFIVDLIERGANPKIGGANEISLINMFITHGWRNPTFLTQLRTLVKRIGDINREDSQGKLVLHVALSMIENKKIRLQTLHLLLEFGASPTKKTSGSKSSACDFVQACNGG